MPTDSRFERAIAAIDRANAEDPNEIEVRGEVRSKELAHADLASEWIEILCNPPTEALRLAARAHHLRRWSLPRSDYPEGRKGYLVWRQALKQRHADEASEILRSCGYDEKTIARVAAIIVRKNLAGDPEAQALEDVACLIFFETQLDDIAARLDPDKLRDVALKSLRLMSPEGRQRVLSLPIAQAYLAVLRELVDELAESRGRAD
ncbi:MAG: DUF4202 domain-containing protein [Myxococcota bacterium]|jgi:hypothetical protein|nr:DUF4202 domain-containing protein [Myxococcota bacterium]